MLATYSNRFGLFFTNWKLLEWQNYAGLLIKNTGLEVFKLRKQQWVKLSQLDFNGTSTTSQPDSKIGVKVLTQGYFLGYLEYLL